MFSSTTFVIKVVLCSFSAESSCFSVGSEFRWRREHWVSGPLKILIKVNEELQKSQKGSGTWVAQSVKRPTSAQGMISRFKGLSPTSGSVLKARSLEPASSSVSPSLSHALSLSLKNKYTLKKFFFEKEFHEA